MYTSSTAQGGGGSFKNRKPIGEIACCESGMAERIHWWTERCLRSPLFLSLSLTIYLPTSLSYRFPIFETSATALCGTTGKKKQHKLTIYLPKLGYNLRRASHQYMIWVNPKQCSPIFPVSFENGKFYWECDEPLDSGVSHFMASVLEKWRMDTSCWNKPAQLDHLDLAMLARPGHVLQQPKSRVPNSDGLRGIVNKDILKFTQGPARNSDGFSCWNGSEWFLKAGKLTKACAKSTAEEMRE